MIIQAPSLICAEKLKAEIPELRDFHGEPIVAGEFPASHKSGLSTTMSRYSRVVSGVVFTATIFKTVRFSI